MRILKIILFSALVVSVSTPQSYAQEAAEESMSDGVAFDAKGAFSKILVAGLVGGILGLSTLSFYNKPNQHLRNITFGAGGAMIGTALYMTIALASSTQSASLYDEPVELPLYGVSPLIAADFGGVNFQTQF